MSLRPKDLSSAKTDPGGLKSSAPPLTVASLKALPAVASGSALKDNLVLAGGLAGAVFLGALTLVLLNNARTTRQNGVDNPEATTAGATPPLAPAPISRPGGDTPVIVMPDTPVSEPLPMASAPMPGPVAAPDAGPRSNALVYDVSAPDPAATTQTTPPENALRKDGAAPLDLNTVQDLTGLQALPQARASQIGNPSATVSQGTLIPAVLETAVNSDLPGYTRALVSRDVRSFDGSTVLIPRGSRLIGLYRSGLQSGQKRVFITWTRLIRPDGASMTLADPSTDRLGQAGQTGDVDTHFLQRFGSSILLSVLGGLANSASRQDGNTIIIGTTQGANSAASAALQVDSRIAPTVRVAQGTPIQVFVSRDLDFTR
ncbi:MAG: TrbI/VirB10 family protein [Asticcacaulis sp.]